MSKTKILTSGDMSCGLMRQKWSALHLEGNGGTLVDLRTPYQLGSSIMLWREDKTLHGDIKTSARKLKRGCKWVFQMDNDSKDTAKVVEKWLEDNKVLVITKPWPESHQKCVGRSEKACVSKATNKPDSVTPILSGGLGQNTSKVQVEACGRLPKTDVDSWLQL